MIFKNYLNKDVLKNIFVLSIITSGLKIFGYAYSFIIFLPFIFFYRKILLREIDRNKFSNKLVIIYFFLLSISSIIGALKLTDIRVIVFWIPLFVYAISIYLITSIVRKDKENYINLLFTSSLLYFTFYFLMTVFSLFYFRNEYGIQDNLWLGSSAAFALSPILLSTLFIKWNEIKFKINSHYSFIFLFYNFFFLLHESRLARLYFLSLFLFIVLKNLQYKKILNALIIIIIVTSFYSFNSYIGANIKNYFYPTNLSKIYPSNIRQDITHFKSVISNINLDKNKFKERVNGNEGRLLELKAGLTYFKKLPIQNKIFGTGWYTSRIDITQTRNEIIDEYLEYNLAPSMIKTNKVDLQGIVALLLDTGLIGTVFTLSLYFIFLLKVIKFEKDYIYRFLIISFLMINILVLFIGYPFVNVIYILSFVPGGILDIYPKNKSLKNKSKNKLLY